MKRQNNNVPVDNEQSDLMLHAQVYNMVNQCAPIARIFWAISNNQRDNHAVDVAFRHVFVEFLYGAYTYSIILMLVGNPLGEIK